MKKKMKGWGRGDKLISTKKPKLKTKTMPGEQAPTGQLPTVNCIPYTSYIHPFPTSHVVVVLTLANCTLAPEHCHYHCPRNPRNLVTYPTMVENPKIHKIETGT